MVAVDAESQRRVEVVVEDSSSLASLLFSRGEEQV
jgi:hypothetical protein